MLDVIKADTASASGFSVIGRFKNPPLYFGLALFAVNSVSRALLTDVQTLIVLRFIHGPGARAGYR